MAGLNFEIEELSITERENPFAPLIEQLISAGDDKQVAISVPADDLKKTKSKIADAANAADRTAKQISVSEPDKKTGEVTYRFRLVARQYRPRKGDETEAE